jgi:hypothetical protein
MVLNLSPLGNAICFIDIVVVYSCFAIRVPWYYLTFMPDFSGADMVQWPPLKVHSLSAYKIDLFRTPYKQKCLNYKLDSSYAESNVMKPIYATPFWGTSTITALRLIVTRYLLLLLPMCDLLLEIGYTVHKLLAHQDKCQGLTVIPAVDLRADISVPRHNLFRSNDHVNHARHAAESGDVGHVPHAVTVATAKLLYKPHCSIIFSGTCTYSGIFERPDDALPEGRDRGDAPGCENENGESA